MISLKQFAITIREEVNVNLIYFVVVFPLAMRHVKNIVKKNVNNQQIIVIDMTIQGNCMHAYKKIQQTVLCDTLQQICREACCYNDYQQHLGIREQSVCGYSCRLRPRKTFPIYQSDLRGIITEKPFFLRKTSNLTTANLTDHLTF